MNKSDILAFIKSRVHAVISTYTPGNYPESAYIGFGETDYFEIIFGTSNKSRKYANLRVNNKVSLVVSDETQSITMQYEGLTQELTPQNRGPYVALYHAKIPEAVKYASLPDQTFFLVTPVWIRTTKISGDTEDIFELKFT